MIYWEKKYWEYQIKCVILYQKPGQSNEKKLYSEKRIVREEKITNL